MSPRKPSFPPCGVGSGVGLVNRSRRGGLSLVGWVDETSYYKVCAQLDLRFLWAIAFLVGPGASKLGNLGIKL